jgi:3-isopropylmalate/(R)-2-methylmalate dehydratase small subunit
MDYGFRCLIAPSYADIFFNNCFKNGMLPVILKAEEVAQLFKEVEATPGYQVTVDLDKQTVTTPSGTSFHFEVDAFRKHCLLNGLDEIGLALEKEAEITVYEQRRKQEAPWLFSDLA